MAAFTLLAPEIVLVLGTFGGREPSGIDAGTTQRLPDLAHAARDSVQERPAGILRKVSAVCHPHRVAQRPSRRPGVSAAAIPRDHMDLGLRRKPGLRGGRLAVRQQPDRPPPLQIADQGAVAMVTSPCSLLRGRCRFAS